MSEREDGGRVLLAGIGNVFLGDDGFGVEVVRRLARSVLPDGVDAADYGIAGVHLAYDLLPERYHTVVLVDALQLDAEPGTLVVLELGAEHEPDAPTADDAYRGSVADVHGMHPQAALRLLRSLGGKIPRVLVVGCQPASLDDGMQLTPPVAAAVDEAARLAIQAAREAVATGRAAQPSAGVG